MAIFNGYVTNYQRVNLIKSHETTIFLWLSYGLPMFIQKKISMLSSSRTPPNQTKVPDKVLGTGFTGLVDGVGLANINNYQVLMDAIDFPIVV